MSGQSAMKIAPSWGGRPPADDAEARQRIRDAARRCIDRGGVNVRIAEVARELGVSRPTIYRHYSSGQAVLLAVALRSMNRFVLVSLRWRSTSVPPRPKWWRRLAACSSSGSLGTPSSVS